MDENLFCTCIFIIGLFNILRTDFHDSLTGKLKL